jgi:phosphoglycolate phosphatase
VGVPRRVVLFDLDGTVLTFVGSSPGPGRTALDETMRELYGLEGATEGLRIAGGTDRAIARAMLERAGVAADEDAIVRVLDAYLERLERILRTRRYQPIGDVERTVGALRAEDAPGATRARGARGARGAVVGLATGNTRGGARLKLASAGLEASFDLSLGGYGCEAEPRAEIVRLAAARCGAGGGDVVVVVGDTEHDVSAARAAGARFVGVATSAAAHAELAAAGVDGAAVVDGCGDALVAAILAASA